MCFILFDIPELGLPYYQRRVERHIVTRFASECAGLRIVEPESYTVNSLAEVMQKYQEFREAGHEGAMAKLPNHLYERRRSFSWMKVKPSMDFDGFVVGINEATSETGEPLGRAGSLLVKMKDNSTANVAGIPHELGRLIWQNQGAYLNHWAECYCMERDRKGGYRHPIFNRFREAKA